MKKTKKIRKTDDPCYDFASCGCGLFENKRGFRVGADFVFIDPCEKCKSNGIMITVKTWRRMRQKKYKGKVVSVNYEVTKL